MQSLERRIAALEKAGTTVEGPQTIIMRALSRGPAENEIQALHATEGREQWKRQPGETEQELIDRASREVTRNGPGCIFLIADD